jgi:copper chaperone CopZ
MKKKTFELPALYGDHHVMEVRRILLEIPGVKDVYASSAFHVVEVAYDEKKVNDQELQVKLDEAGYLGEWPIFTDSKKVVTAEESKSASMRHTAVYEQIKQTVSFSQNVGYRGRPLWPCPGMGLIKGMDEEK